jgi:hypothetical protein
MEKRIETADGRVIRLHVDDEAVTSDADDRPPIEGDPDDDIGEGGSAEAIILIDKQPNTMTVEGAIAAVGQTARAMYGGRHQWEDELSWWHSWGKYVLGIVLLLGVMIVLPLLGSR